MMRYLDNSADMTQWIWLGTHDVRVPRWNLNVPLSIDSENLKKFFQVQEVSRKAAAHSCSTESLLWKTAQNWLENSCDEVF